MGAREGRVAILTSAGRGSGREHAPVCAAEGVEVEVNDRGDVLAAHVPTLLT